MKVHIFTTNLPTLQKQAEYTKAQKGKWYHWERVYIIKASGQEKYGFITMNFFERLARNLFHIQGIKKGFKGEKIVVIDSKMQKMNDVSKILNPSLRIHNPRLYNIPTEINAIKEEKNLETKRASFQQIYSLLRTEALAGRLEKKDHFLLYSLLEAYAGQTLYAQTFNGDKEAGFRKSANLMEFSLRLQLKGGDNWTRFESLDALSDHVITDYTHRRPSEQNRILHIARKNDNSETIKDTLIRLAYSYQNITSMNQPTEENIKFHSFLNELTEKFLKNDPKGIAEFAYNRRPFLFALKNPQDILGKINSYKELLPLFRSALSPFEYKRKDAQVHNMFGLILTRSNIEPAVALQYFTKAYELNNELVNEASPEEVATQKFLRANVLSSLISALCKAEQLDAAKPHVAALKSYIEELDQSHNYHSYREGYEKAIAIYDEAVKNQKI